MYLRLFRQSEKGEYIVNTVFSRLFKRVLKSIHRKTLFDQSEASGVRIQVASEKRVVCSFSFP